MRLGDYMKQAWRLIKVGRLHGSAMRLEKENRLEQAYEIAVDALTILWSLNSANPPVVTNTVLITTLLDSIALRLEKPLMTKNAVAKALELCRMAGFVNPEPGDALKKHIDWLKHRQYEQQTAAAD